MTRKTSNTNINNAVKDYLSGDSCKVAATRWNTSQKTLSNYLKANGLFRSKSEIAKIKSVKLSANVWNKIAMPEAEIIALYESGVAEWTIAKQFNVSRQVIKRILVNNNITRRTQSEANMLFQSKRTIAEKKASIANAQEWTRGKKLPYEHLCNSAKGIERSKANVSTSEKFLFDLLLDRGIVTIPQKAVGKYNIDLAVFPVAIEVFGGGWHASKPNHIERTRYLLNNGWNVVFVWANVVRNPLSNGVADYIITFLDELSSNPSSISQYRVLRGDGKELSRGSMNDDNISIVVRGYQSIRGGRFDKITG